MGRFALPAMWRLRISRIIKVVYNTRISDIYQFPSYELHFYRPVSTHIRPVVVFASLIRHETQKITSHSSSSHNGHWHHRKTSLKLMIPLACYILLLIILWQENVNPDHLKEVTGHRMIAMAAWINTTIHGSRFSCQFQRLFCSLTSLIQYPYMAVMISDVICNKSCIHC